MFDGRKSLIYNSVLEKSHKLTTKVNLFQGQEMRALFWHLVLANVKLLCQQQFYGVSLKIGVLRLQILLDDTLSTK